MQDFGRDGVNKVDGERGFRDHAGDGGESVDAESGEGFEVRLHSRSGGAVGAGNGQGDGLGHGQGR